VSFSIEFAELTLQIFLGIVDQVERIYTVFINCQSFDFRFHLNILFFILINNLLT